MSKTLTLPKGRIAGPPPIEPNAAYDYEQAAARLQVGKRVVENLVHDGLLKAAAVGRLRRILGSSLLEYLKGEHHGAEAKNQSGAGASKEPAA